MNDIKLNPGYILKERYNEMSISKFSEMDRIHFLEELVDYVIKDRNELRQKLSMIEVKARRIGEKEEYQEIAEKLFYALDGLLFDTQHANHNCEDDGCPVAFAQTVLDEYKEKFLNKV